MRENNPAANYANNFPAPFHYPQLFSPPEPEHTDPFAIDSLIHERPRILQTKLAVVATEIEERLFLRRYNLEAISREYLEATNRILMLAHTRMDASDPACRFWLEQQMRLAVEARQQRVECWQDVSKLLNDFLVIWEALEQSRVRANFLKDQREEDRP